MAAPTPEPTNDQHDLLDQLRATAKARGLTLRAACVDCGTGTAITTLLRRVKASPSQVAKVQAWINGAWSSMTTATKADDQALAKAVTKTKAKRRRLRLATSGPAVQPAARRYLLDIAAILGVRPIAVYQVQGDRLVESQALPIGAA